MADNSIKALGSLRPNGDFPLAFAEDIQVSEEGTRLSSALKNIDTKINNISDNLYATEIKMSTNDNTTISEKVTELSSATSNNKERLDNLSATDMTYKSLGKPDQTVQDAIDELNKIFNQELFFDYTEDTAQYCPILRPSFGDKMTITFLLTTIVTGTYKIQVERRLYSSSTFSLFKEDNTSQGGRVTIDLGVATDYSDYVYRVYARDSLGKQATYVRDDVTQKYIEFRIIPGAVEYTSLFSETAANNVFGTDTTSIDFSFTSNYGENGYRYLLFDIHNIDTPSKDESMWGVMPLGYCVGLVNSQVSLSTSFTLEDEDSTFVINSMLVVSPDNVLDLTSSTISRSGILTDTFQILRANSVGVTIQTTFEEKVDTETFISLKFLPLTNIPVLQGYNRLYVTCKLYVKDNGVEELRSAEFAVSHGRVSSWSVGALTSQGDYRLEVTCYDQNKEYVSPTRSIDFTVVQSEAVGSTFVGQTDDGYRSHLLFNFTANSELDNDNWVPSHKGNDTQNFRLRLVNLNPTLGRVSADSKTWIKLAGDAYGILEKEILSGGDNTWIPYNPWEVLSEKNNTGFTLETYMRTECVGSLNAKVISCRNDSLDTASAGANISYDSVRIDTQKNILEYPLLENAWQHIAIVVNRVINTSEDENMNPYATIRVYVNGTLSKILQSSIVYNQDGETEITYNPGEIYPLMLNASARDAAGNILADSQGACDISFVRCYSTGLTSSQIYGNFLNSLQQAEREPIVAKNTTAIPTVFFVKNRPPQEDASEALKAHWNLRKAAWAEKSIVNTTFKRLHTITEKTPTTEGALGSKTACVNCTMHYRIGEGDDIRWQKFDDVDVYLQGTSSLEYPVKNYQIKIFRLSGSGTKDSPYKRSKQKILPPFKGAAEGWFVEDNVFTLKCDYMEQSHRNNTPTAAFYNEQVLDAVIRANNEVSSENVTDIFKYYSPARRVQLDLNTTKVSKYRDAIDGYACVVYRNDNGFINEESFSGDDSNAQETLTITEKDVYTGSYMFNVDKEGKQLGFEIDIAEVTSGSSINPLFSDIVSPEHDIRYDADNNISGFIVRDASGNDTGLTISTLPCVSYEGGTNSNSSAAAFIPYESSYEAYLIEKYETKYASKDLTQEEFMENARNGDYEFLQDPDMIVYTETTYMEKIGDEYDYIKSTLEPRYSFIDEIDIPKTADIDTKSITYNRMQEVINWVYEASQDDEKFKEEFENYFDFNYCLTYYLQMMVFTQVDNAGKNAMFDYWGYNGKLYPRPYDMDTQMGEDNSGQDRIPVSSELHASLSPSSISGTELVYIQIPTYASTSVMSHYRYKNYNTYESRLWKTFGRVFLQQISSTYNALRSNGIYTVDNICNFVDSMTYNVIGETFYNKDAVSKYISYTVKGEDGVTNEYSNQYLYALQGNRANRYKQYLRQRLIFLDSYFGCAIETYKTMELRVNSTSSSSPIGIKVYSPQYLYITVDDKQAKLRFFADPDDTYVFRDGSVYNGTLVYIPTTGADKNVVIHGAGNIQQINHTANLNLSKYLIANATKITNVDLSNNVMLHELALGNNRFIKRLLLNGTSALKVSLDVSRCTNIEEIILSNSGVTGIELPTQSNLKKLDLKNSKIVSLELSNLSLLTNHVDNKDDIPNLNLSGCTSLTTLTIRNCSEIENIQLTTLPNLAYLTIEDCPKIDTVKVDGLKALQEINLKSNYIKTLSASAARGVAFENLTLMNTPNINSINLYDLRVSASSTTRTGKLYLPVTPEGVSVTLDLTGARISTISTRAEETTTGLYDFARINVAKLTFYRSENNIYSSYVTEIRNLKCEQSLSSLFMRCSKLQRILDSSFKSTGTSCNSMFNRCTSLVDLQNVDWDLESCTTASSMFYDCNVIKYKYLKSVLDSLTHVTDLSSFLNSGYAPGDIGSNDDYPEVIGRDLLKNAGKDAPVGSTIKLNSMFYGTKFTIVDPGLLDYNQFKNYCTEVTSMFAGSSLEYAPKTIFRNLPSLRNAAGAFQSCSNLGTTPSYKGISCILTDDYDVFSVLDSNETPTPNTSIENVRAMFLSCTNIFSESVTQVENNDLCAFFDNIPNVKNIEALFYNVTGLKHLPEGVLANTTQITTSSFVFMKTNITKLPNTLFWRGAVSESGFVVPYNKTTHTALTSMRGMFADCTNLEGIIHRYFFAATPNVTSIGSEDASATLPAASTVIHCGGMFANTKISGMHNESLTCMSALQDVSLLFFSGTKGGTYTNGSTAATYIGSKTNTPFLFYSDSSPSLLYENYQESNSKVPKAIFKNLNNLSNVSGMFTSKTITGIETDDTEECSIFKYTPRIKHMAGMFANCNTLSSIALNKLFKTTDSLGNVIPLSELTDVSHMFADTDVSATLPETIFEGCSKLSSTCGLFMNCKNLSGAVSPKLFNDCRGSITNVSHMFYGCEKLNRIECGYALINDLFELNTRYENYVQQFYSGRAGYTEFVSRYPSIDSFQIAVRDGTYPPTDTEDVLYEDSQLFETKDSYIDNANVVKIEQAGLLADCVNLTNVTYMFANCTSLQGRIPPDMFWSSTRQNFNGITSLEHLFDCCHNLTLRNANGVAELRQETTVMYRQGETIDSPLVRLSSLQGGNHYSVYPSVLYNTEQGVIEYNLEADSNPYYLVPANWLAYCPNVENISYAFYNVGLKRDANKKLELPYTSSTVGSGTTTSAKYLMHALSLPLSMFEYQKITDASYAFAFMGTICNTDLTNTFMQSSAMSLENVAFMFFCTHLNSIGTETQRFLEFNSSTNYSLLNTNHAFYQSTAVSHPVKTDDGKYLIPQSICTIGTEIDSKYTRILQESKLDPNSYGPAVYDGNKFQNVQNYIGTFGNTYIKPYYQSNSVNTDYSSYVTGNSGYTAINITNGTGFTKTARTWCSNFNIPTKYT